MRNIQKHTFACDTMNIHMQRQTTGMPYLLKDKQSIQQITRPRMDKKRSRRSTPSLTIVHNYVSAFTTNKPDPTPCKVIYSLGVVAVFRYDQDIVGQFTVLHVANCHDQIWWTMSDYFPVYWFWATVCASTRDNRNNRVHSKYGSTRRVWP